MIVYSKEKESLSPEKNNSNKKSQVNTALEVLANALKQRAKSKRLSGQVPTCIRSMYEFAQFVLHSTVCASNLTYMLLLKHYCASIDYAGWALPDVVDGVRFENAVSTNLDVSLLANDIMTTGSKVRSCCVLLYLQYQVLSAGQSTKAVE